jgi:hypothetical protein
MLTVKNDGRLFLSVSSLLLKPFFSRNLMGLPPLSKAADRRVVADPITESECSLARSITTNRRMRSRGGWPAGDEWGATLKTWLNAGAGAENFTFVQNAFSPPNLLESSTCLDRSMFVSLWYSAVWNSTYEFGEEAYGRHGGGGRAVPECTVTVSMGRCVRGGGSFG